MCAGAVKQRHVARVKQVEATVGEDHAATLRPQLTRNLGGLVPVGQDLLRRWASLTSLKAARNSAGETVAVPSLSHADAGGHVAELHGPGRGSPAAIAIPRNATIVSPAPETSAT